MSDKQFMSFDPLVVNPGRLQILTALMLRERQEFVHLRQTTRLTDGNLAAHAKRLRSGGLITVEKQFRDGKPVTHITLTPAGRAAMVGHVRGLLAAIEPQAAEVEPPLPTPAELRPVEEDWVD